MKHPLARAAAMAAIPMLAACASVADDRYPSLAIRDVERAQGRFDPLPTQQQLAVPPVAVPAGGGSLADRLAALGVAASAAHRNFLGIAPRAEQLVRAASGAAIGSDAWASAQVALADLDSARSATAIALADLDTLMIAGAVQAEDIGAIERVRQQVIAEVEQEDATLARLRARVR